MSTLPEIEAATEGLPRKEQEELFLFLASRLRAGGGEMPAPSLYSRAQLDAWVLRDEADMDAFRAGDQT